MFVKLLSRYNASWPHGCIWLMWVKHSIISIHQSRYLLPMLELKFYNSFFCFRLNRLMMAVPNIQTIDIANIRENSSRPTTDVKFIFVDKDSGEKLELNAHKLILAYGSEVFMTQFFGSFKEERDTIPVEDASYNAFKIFLDVLYNKKTPMNQASFKLLGEL